MPDKKINVDAHIPSDTEQFDKKVAQMKRPMRTPEREELDHKLSLLVSRLSSYANFHTKNEHIIDEKTGQDLGLGPLDVQCYVQTILTNCQVIEFSGMLQEKLTAMSKILRKAESTYLNARLNIAPLRGNETEDIARQLADVLATDEIELLNRTVKNVENYLHSLQQQFGIQITAEGVTINVRTEPAGPIPTEPDSTSKPN